MYVCMCVCAYVCVCVCVCFVCLLPMCAYVISIYRYCDGICHCASITALQVLNYLKGCFVPTWGTFPYRWECNPHFDQALMITTANLVAHINDCLCTTVL